MREETLRTGAGSRGILPCCATICPQETASAAREEGVVPLLQDGTNRFLKTKSRPTLSQRPLEHTTGRALVGPGATCQIACGPLGFVRFFSVLKLFRIAFLLTHEFEIFAIAVPNVPVVTYKRLINRRIRLGVLSTDSSKLPCTICFVYCKNHTERQHEKNGEKTT